MVITESRAVAMHLTNIFHSSYSSKLGYILLNIGASMAGASVGIIISNGASPVSVVLLVMGALILLAGLGLLWLQHRILVRGRKAVRVLISKKIYRDY